MIGPSKPFKTSGVGRRTTMNDSSGVLGVIVGALIVIGVIWFAFGDRLGILD
jgi:hypothetical protein